MAFKHMKHVTSPFRAVQRRLYMQCHASWRCAIGTVSCFGLDISFDYSFSVTDGLEFAEGLLHGPWPCTTKQPLQGPKGHKQGTDNASCTCFLSTGKALDSQATHGVGPIVIIYLKVLHLNYLAPMDDLPNPSPRPHSLASASTKRYK